MTKYFKNVKSFEDLKEQFRALARKNHPDAGGDVETMKEINTEYDALFVIWKDRHNATVEPQEQTTETADSTRQQFYTQFGWEGSNHNWDRSLKEVAQIVRAYVKEKYPTYKFSVRTSYASMCQELHVELKESPIEIYKAYADMNDEDKSEVRRKLEYNHLWRLTSWTEAEEKEIFEKAWSENGDFFRCLNDATKEVAEDVDAFVNSYNFKDCDGAIDYFDVDFYYFGCCRNNGENIKIVPKTARIKKTASEPSKSHKKGRRTEKEAALEIEQKTGYTYKITKGEDTRDGSELWIVRINETLDKDAYIAESKAMRERGGYYSKFKHGFIFRFDPTEKLNGDSVA